MQNKEPETFYPVSQAAWRQWLKVNHRTKQSVWVICYKMKAGMPTITWSEGVNEALCFGWIDSTRRSLDKDRFLQYFAKRKVGSTWSKINKAKVEKLIVERRMTKAGLASIETAKQNGTWKILDGLDTLIVPPDLSKEFKTQKGSKEFFLSLSNSARKSILQ